MLMLLLKDIDSGPECPWLFHVPNSIRLIIFEKFAARVFKFKHFGNNCRKILYRICSVNLKFITLVPHTGHHFFVTAHLITKIIPKANRSI